MVVTVESDVLVLGTGGAGLRAAIEAEARGASVAVVSKAPAGMNNATVVSGGGFRAALVGLIPEAEGDLTPEEHLRDTIEVGKRINDRRLVEVLAHEGGERVLELKRFGVEIRLRPNGISVGDQPSLMGLGLTKPLVDYARSREIMFFDNVIVTRILEADKGVAGAIGYDAHDDQPLIFYTKAVILATGGAGALYKRTDCPLRTTGDGYSLAFRAGARLRDMEFVQFFPLALAEPGMPPYLVGGPMTEEGRIINSLGEDIPLKHGVTVRPFVLKSRDLLSRAIMIEVLEGRGVDGAALLDATEVMGRHGEDIFASTGSYRFFRDTVKAAEKPFRVAPISHFCMGGVVTDENGETGVPGLFAAGEVVGGIHGANRHGGNALTDIIVFGARAGAAAAEYSKPFSILSVETDVLEELNRYEKMRSGDAEGAVDPREVMSRLRETMWRKAGVVRSGAMLKEALNEVAELKELVPKLRASSGRMMMEALEVPMALEASEIICTSALERTESRGAHYRTDHPEEDEGWLRSVVVSLGSGGEIKISAEPV